MAKEIAFFTISGGVGDYAATDDVQIVFIDWDDFNDRPNDLSELQEIRRRVYKAIEEAEQLPSTGSVGEKRAINLRDLYECLNDINHHIIKANTVLDKGNQL